MVDISFVVFNHLSYVFWLLFIVNAYSFEERAGLIKIAYIFTTLLGKSIGSLVRLPTSAPAPNSCMTLSKFL